jgi:hypothetical protein
LQALGILMDRQARRNDMKQDSAPLVVDDTPFCCRVGNQSGNKHELDMVQAFTRINPRPILKLFLLLGDHVCHGIGFELGLECGILH